MDAVIIRKTRLPEGVAGITLKDENGDYNIYLNETCSAFRPIFATVTNKSNM